MNAMRIVVPRLDRPDPVISEFFLHNARLAVLDLMIVHMVHTFLVPIEEMMLYLDNLPRSSI